MEDKVQLETKCLFRFSRHSVMMLAGNWVPALTGPRRHTATSKEYSTAAGEEPHGKFPNAYRSLALEHFGSEIA